MTIRLSFRRPGVQVAPELVAQCVANRLPVTRQLLYNRSGRTVDLGLSVNGTPVALRGIENALTGQNIDHATEQYRTDWNLKNVTLGRRALVHLAFDLVRSLTGYRVGVMGR